jgi:hypothetical protein
MNRPIVLWTPRRSTASDDAGITIIKSVLPPPIPPGPYEHDELAAIPTFHYMPPLSYFAIRKLIEYPDQIDTGGARIHYQRPYSPSEYDILSALMPGYSVAESEAFLRRVDPRLWAVIVQIYTNIPKNMRVYPIPLSDKHLPLLQHISPAPDFCLLTVVEIPGCRELTDDTILELKELHGLCALDASRTDVTGFGVKRFSSTLSACDQGWRGPWRLRMLRLKDCRKMDNTVISTLSVFPLLSVVGSSTQCLDVYDD